MDALGNFPLADVDEHHDAAEEEPEGLARF